MATADDEGVARARDGGHTALSARKSRALRKLLREADQGDGSRPYLASVLQEDWQSANNLAGLLEPRLNDVRVKYG